jgi:beta-N-acetylhexosaminidase
MKKILLFLMMTLLLTACEKGMTELNDNSTEKPLKTEASVVTSEDSKNDEEEINNEIKDNPSNEAEKNVIEEKISNMTLEDKIEQMIIVDYSLVARGNSGGQDVTKLSSEAAKVITNHNFAGIILFKDNASGTKQVLELTSDIQKAATSADSKHKIPLFIGIDQEGGWITRLSTGTSMPGNMALGAINDYETAKEYSTIIGEELNALGINLDFAPVLDVNSNPNNPIIGVRSFSSNTEIVSKMGEAFIEGLQSQKIASTIKHFPGHGDTATDSHTGLPLINKSYEDIKSLELIPFKAGIDKGADMIMTAHIVYPQIETTKYISKKTKEEISLPATLSKTILTDILRNDLGFEGIIVTDALNMSAVAEHFDKKDVAKYALNAGVDILLMPVSLISNSGSVDDYVKMVADLVRSGEIPEENINQSVRRILKQKQKMGLLNDTDFGFTEEKITDAANIVGSKQHHDKELEIAKKAITLVKGEEILPISKDEKVLFLNGYKNEKNNMEYAVQILKNQGILDDSFDYEISNYEGKKYSDLKGSVNKASLIVVTTNFDNKKTGNDQVDLVKIVIAEAHKEGKKVIILSCMLPYDVAKYQDADAVLCAYGDKAITELPIVYNGETKTFGANMTAGIIKLFDGEEFVASLPVEI